MRTFWTFITGLTAGAVIALLYAPDRGSETRRKVTQSAKRLTGDVRDEFEEGMDDLSETGEEMYRKSGRMARNITNR